MADLGLIFADVVGDRREAVLDNLRRRDKLDAAALARAELVAQRTQQPVEQVLNQLGALSDDDLAQAYAAVCGCDVWDPAAAPPLLDAATLEVSLDFLRQKRLLPLHRDGDILVCAACDPLDEEAQSGLTFALGGAVELLAARLRDWRAHFDLMAQTEGPSFHADERRLEQEVEQVADLGGEGPGAKLVSAVFEAAAAAGASDIHFEPRRHDLRVRLRIDGRLVDYRTAPIDLAPPAVSRVKVIANLDLGERRLPQDGRTTFIVGGRQIDVRVATAPTVFGESAVLRILDRANVPFDLEALGFDSVVTGGLRRAAASPHGLFLVTGPTGSGKTTTLYALLETFAGSPKKILSVEDPVEYHFEHVSQTQVQPGIGLTFASALRSFLRQDPDVILVGEIRDPETAEVAMQAAMTGHFVLASVHANDAVAVIPRLLDIGLEPYQLAAGLRGAAAQRLVRRLCPDCKVAAAPGAEDAAIVAALELSLPESLYRPNGCSACNGEGYRGRVAIGEAFLTDPAFLRAIAAGEGVESLARHAVRGGLAPMALDGARKVLAGVTTFTEVMAAVHA